MEFRRECGRCDRPLTDDGPAYVCAYECTFCPTCYRQLRYCCPDCSGELVRRPRRRTSESSPPPPKTRADHPVTVRRATDRDLDAVAPLFDAYRQFYEQPADLPRSHAFLSERIAREESVVLLAEAGDVPVGFVQLYPLFSSISLGPIYVLNDLFVRPDGRRHGVGTRLLEAARAFGEAERAHYLELSTAVDNPAQRVYEGCGWQLDREFLHYELLLRTKPDRD